MIFDLTKSETGLGYYDFASNSISSFILRNEGYTVEFKYLDSNISNNFFHFSTKYGITPNQITTVRVTISSEAPIKNFYVYALNMYDETAKTLNAILNIDNENYSLFNGKDSCKGFDLSEDGEPVNEISFDIMSLSWYQYYTAISINEYVDYWDKNKGESIKHIVEKEDVLINSLELNETRVVLVVGEFKQLVPIIKPENATNKNLLWVSSKPHICDVKDGLLEAKIVGNANIMCVSQDGTNISSVCVVSVVRNPGDIVYDDASESYRIHNEYGLDVKLVQLESTYSDYGEGYELFRSNYLDINFNEIYGDMIKSPKINYLDDESIDQNKIIQYRIPIEYKTYDILFRMNYGWMYNDWENGYAEFINHNVQNAWETLDKVVDDRVKYQIELNGVFYNINKCEELSDKVILSNDDNPEHEITVEFVKDLNGDYISCAQSFASTSKITLINSFSIRTKDKTTSENDTTFSINDNCILQIAGVKNHMFTPILNINNVNSLYAVLVDGYNNAISSLSKIGVNGKLSSDLEYYYTNLSILREPASTQVYLVIFTTDIYVDRDIYQQKNPSSNLYDWENHNLQNLPLYDILLFKGPQPVIYDTILTEDEMLYDSEKHNKYALVGDLDRILYINYIDDKINSIKIDGSPNIVIDNFILEDQTVLKQINEDRSDLFTLIFSKIEE